MKFLFKTSFVLKILFFTNIVFYLLYEEGTSANVRNDSFNMEIKFPLFFYVWTTCFIIACFFSSIVTYFFAFRPCSRFSQYFQQRRRGRIIYFVEIILLVTTIKIVQTKLADAFREPGIMERYFSTALGLKMDEGWSMEQKLNAINFMILAAAMVLFIVSFWNVRRANKIECAQPS